MPESMDEVVNVFFSYSHEDLKYCKELEKHLFLLKRQRIISAWTDRKIDAGEKWEENILTNLNKAHIILLLISANFMASDYCYQEELEIALKRHEDKNDVACIIPIIISPVDWQTAEFGKFQALPTGGKPATEWSSLDAAFADVAKGIRVAVEKIKAEISRRVDEKPESPSKARTLQVLQAPQKKDEAKYRSMDSATSAQVHFSNMTDATVQIHWLDYQGKRKHYHDLEPSQSCLQMTFVTHPWLVTNDKGKGIALFMPEPGMGRAVIAHDRA